MEAGICDIILSLFLGVLMILIIFNIMEIQRTVIVDMTNKN